MSYPLPILFIQGDIGGPGSSGPHGPAGEPGDAGQQGEAGSPGPPGFAVSVFYSRVDTTHLLWLPLFS